MIKFLQKIQNIGIDANTDLESAKRIRLCNEMSIAGIVVGFIVFSYALLSSWPLILILAISFLAASGLIPPILNFCNKTIASRIAYLIISFCSE